MMADVETPPPPQATDTPSNQPPVHAAQVIIPESRPLNQQPQFASPINQSSPATEGEADHISSHQNASDVSRHSTPATSATGEVSEEKETQQNMALTAAETTDKPLESLSQEAPIETQPPTESKSDPELDPLQDVRPAYFYPIDPSSSSSPDSQHNLLEQGVPVFHPTMEQFHNFYAYCQAIDRWGMQSGIVKVVPPKEWIDALPSLKTPIFSKPVSFQQDQGAAADPADISAVRIKNAIVQHFTPAGSGVWRQTNVTRTVKVWNAKQWSDACISQDQKGPEMQRMKWKVEVDGVTNGGWGPKKLKEGEKDPHAAILEEDGVRTRSGKARPSNAATDQKTGIKRKRPTSKGAAGAEPSGSQPLTGTEDAPADEEMPPLENDTNVSPRGRSLRSALSSQAAPAASTSPSPSKAKKVIRAETTTQEEWEKFDYKTCWTKEGLAHDQIAQLEQEADSTDERDARPQPPAPSAWNEATCREIESEYWRGLNFGKPPMYGADLQGTLFDDRTKVWNVGKLDNLLTRLRLRRRLPGVTTPYLYWGMWRATFAWHVEDMDLYSINYIHFGAPKQWYSIRQADRQRFESAMASAFPSDSRRCPHFMRHKSYLASPSFLASHGIRPLRLVHHAGEFVITYPFGYHSGFNMGYNCAESVNFALESWLEIGRKANYCHCDQAQQSVRIDVDAMLEESKELEEADRRKELKRIRDEGAQGEEDEEAEKRRIRNEKAREKRKLKKEKEAAAPDAGELEPSAPTQAENTYTTSTKKAPAKGAISTAGLTLNGPCVFCPSSGGDDFVRIPNQIEVKNLAGKHAHRLCASFIPETWIGKSDDGRHEIVCGVEGIEKARYSLKCQICPTPVFQKMGAKIQCTRGKCSRSAHVSCALMEEHGWFIDVCTTEVADRLEAKTNAGAKGFKKKKKGVEAEPVDAAAAPEEAAAEDDERLVVLCRSHNPLFRQAEEDRKAEELRERILALALPSIIKIKSSGGVVEAIMTDAKDIPDVEGEVIIDDQGRSRAIKFSRIILEEKEKPASKVNAEAEPDAAPMSGVAMEEAASALSPAKRPRKARKKAAAADATSEDGANGASPLAKKPRSPKKAAPKSPAQPSPQGMMPMIPAAAAAMHPVHQVERSTDLDVAERYQPREFVSRGPRPAYHLAHLGAPLANAHAGGSSFPTFGHRYAPYGPGPTPFDHQKPMPSAPQMNDYHLPHPQQLHPSYAPNPHSMPNQYRHSPQTPLAYLPHLPPTTNHYTKPLEDRSPHPPEYSSQHTLPTYSRPLIRLPPLNSQRGYDMPPHDVAPPQQRVYYTEDGRPYYAPSALVYHPQQQQQTYYQQPEQYGYQSREEHYRHPEMYYRRT